jgi:hypothetical protein
VRSNGQDDAAAERARAHLDGPVSPPGDDDSCGSGRRRR